MLQCCFYYRTALTLSDYSDISQVVIALANLFLAWYVIKYQIGKDSAEKNATARLHEQNLKLQWFKELIVQPNLSIIDKFYRNLQSLQNEIKSNELTIEEKERINNFVKAELAIIRKSFVDALLQVDKEFGTVILKNLDTLVDNITNAIFDEELKLKLNTVYEKHIGSKINYSKNSLIGQLYNYKGC
jgi:ribonuclease HIII